MPKKTLDYLYRFRFEKGPEKTFAVKLDADTLSLPQPQGPAPDWTKLSHNQCPNCPLKESTHPQCPPAAQLASLLPFFGPFLSHEPVEVFIETERRIFSHKTTVQKGLSSLMGIYMVSSGCPILDRLRPMVRYHLPFANLEETQYRALSTYLLQQFFLSRKGEKADWDLKGLKDGYAEIRRVNVAFKKRLSSVIKTGGQDAIPNAIVILNLFADSFSFYLSEQQIDKIGKLFLLPDMGKVAK